MSIGTAELMSNLAKLDMMSPPPKKEAIEPIASGPPKSGPKWIMFRGDSKPVRMDELSLSQEIRLENGCPFTYVSPPKETFSFNEDKDVFKTPTPKHKRKPGMEAPSPPGVTFACYEELIFSWVHE